MSIHVCALEAHRKLLINQLSLAYGSVMFLWSLLVEKERKTDASLFAPIYFQAVCVYGSLNLFVCLLETLTLFWSSFVVS